MKHVVSGKYDSSTSGVDLSERVLTRLFYSREDREVMIQAVKKRAEYADGDPVRMSSDGWTEIKRDGKWSSGYFNHDLRTALEKRQRNQIEILLDEIAQHIL
jgi:hypothetical protein